MCCEHQNFDNHADCEHTGVNHRCSHNINLEFEFHGCTRGLVGVRGYLPGGAAPACGWGGTFGSSVDGADPQNSYDTRLRTGDRGRGPRRPGA